MRGATTGIGWGREAALSRACRKEELVYHYFLFAVVDRTAILKWVQMIIGSTPEPGSLGPRSRL